MAASASSSTAMESPVPFPDVHRHRLLRLTPDRLLQPLQNLLRRAQARDPEHDAVTEEDLAEGAADDGADPEHRFNQAVYRGASVRERAGTMRSVSMSLPGRGMPSPESWRRL